MKKDCYFDIVLIEKPSYKGLTKSEVIDLYDMLSESEGFSVDIGDSNGNCAAMGFITPEAAKELMYDYGQHSALGEFISSILGDSNEESEDGTYTFKDFKIWMGIGE